MKFIIIGLGNFGSSLSEKLTLQGSEVIGVDINMSKVDAFKEKISHTICLDATDANTISGLPLKDADVVIVAIGEDQGANILATAILKKMNPKRLISRAITPLHDTVLQAIGVDEIIHPEEETAERWSNKLNMTDTIDSLVLNRDFSIVEIPVPKKYVGGTLEDINFFKNHNVMVLSVLTYSDRKQIIGLLKNSSQIKKIATPQTILKEGEILLVYGDNEDIKDLLRFIKS